MARSGSKCPGRFFCPSPPLPQHIITLHASTALFWIIVAYRITYLATLAAARCSQCCQIWAGNLAQSGNLDNRTQPMNKNKVSKEHNKSKPNGGERCFTGEMLYLPVYSLVRLHQHLSQIPGDGEVWRGDLGKAQVSLSAPCAAHAYI